MKVLAIAFAAGALAIVGAASAGGAGGSASGGSHLTVHNVFGLQTLELRNFGFSAKLHADGTADGWFNYTEVDDGAAFHADGSVWCVTVIGNDAWVGATIEHASDPSYNGLGAWWHVTDNGEGANAPADITTFLGVGSQAETQAFCDTHPAYKHPFAIDGGNIQVRN
jgi:hypothetical protein